ncbi:MAG TPA: NUDIX hydrolase [Myxococcales bacterium]|nr:NUDIX hydrolase [Myxococcales bacterium]HAN31837.1 NUDIX hydrolase [Myxococcales bacterium]
MDLRLFQHDWSPVDVATLLVIRRGGRLLLIRKKRGLGKGLINAAGGRLEAGETPRQAAIREVEEELGITPSSPSWCGEHRFQFVDGYSMHVHVYVAGGYRGSPRETDEAIPIWISDQEVPYAQMWADDAHWLPLLLSGRRFSGHYIFDGAQMKEFSIRVLGPNEPAGDLA